MLLADSSDRFYNTVPSVNRAIHAELATGRYDILFCEYWFWDQRIFAFPGLKVIDANDVQAMRVESLLDRTTQPLDRLLKRRLVARYRRMEAEGLARADLVVATTSRDRTALAAMLPPRVETLVIPTGLDTDYFVPQAEILPEPRPRGLLRGAYQPMNRDAAVSGGRHPAALRARVPRRAAHLGRRLPAAGALRDGEARPRDPLTGYVEDVRGPLSRAAVVVCPLRFGYGIRGRIFELLSMNVPVVATPIAVAGMDLAAGDGLMLAEGADAFATAVADLLCDPARRAALAERGREVAVQRMSIEATYDKLVEHLAQRVGLGGRHDGALNRARHPGRAARRRPPGCRPGNGGTGRGNARHRRRPGDRRRD